MAHDHVGVIRQALDALSRRDLDAAFRDTDPEVEVDWSASRGTEAGVYRGLKAVRAFWLNFYDVFDEVTLSPEELIGRGDRVVVAMRARFRRSDGIAADTRFALVASLRGGRIIRWRLHQELADALDSFGSD